MTDVKRLLDEAKPLPWKGIIPLLGGSMQTQANRRLAVHAVDRLPDYEAAVDALAELDALFDSFDDELFHALGMKRNSRVLVEASEAVRRLRGEA